MGIEAGYSELNKTLPAGAWTGRATIPAVEGVEFEEGQSADTKIPCMAGDVIGEFTLTKVLCTRPHCRLFLAEGKEQDRAVIKIYEPGAAGTTDALRKLYSRLQEEPCPSLMPLLSYGDIEGGMHYQVMPVYQEGTLETTVITEEEIIREILQQLNDALLFLKKNRLVHNDIKPSNIFWRDKEKKTIVLGDYDCLTTDAESTKAGGTPFFMAPERIFSNDMVHTSLTDYCAMGLTMAALILGRPLMEDSNTMKAANPAELRNILYRKWQQPVSCPSSMPVSIKTRILLNELVMAEPDKRKMYCGEYISQWLQKDGLTGGISYKNRKKTQFRGLSFSDKLILDIPELIKALGQNWEYGIMMMKEHQLDNFVRQFDGRFYTFCQQYAGFRNGSEGLFKLMQSLAPSEDFYWMGTHYDSLESFAVRTEQTGQYRISDPFSRFCQAGLLSFYIENNNGDRQQVQRAAEIEKIGRKDPDAAVKRLLISLQEKPELHWKGTELRSLDDLLLYLEDHRENLDEEIKWMYSSGAFKVWLNYIQHGNLLSAVNRKMVEKKI